MNHRGAIDYLELDGQGTPEKQHKHFDLAGKFRSRFYWLQWKWHLARGQGPILDHYKLAKGTTPVVINNFNRLKPLVKLIKWLEQLDQGVSIVIIDNLSTYPPLLSWYDQLSSPHIQVMYLGFNSGLWGIDYVVNQLPSDRHYIVTDADLIPYPDTPSDILHQMMLLLDQDEQINHVGVSIEINDIPASSPLCESVQHWEAQFWRKPYASKKQRQAPAFHAPVDTTFAMYRPTSKVNSVFKSLRMGRPYTLKHVDWYEHPEHLSDEYEYYLQHCRPIATWAQAWREVLQTGAEAD